MLLAEVFDVFFESSEKHIIGRSTSLSPKARFLLRYALGLLAKKWMKSYPENTPPYKRGKDVCFLSLSLQFQHALPHTSSHYLLFAFSSLSRMLKISSRNQRSSPPSLTFLKHSSHISPLWMSLICFPSSISYLFTPLSLFLFSIQKRRR